MTSGEYLAVPDSGSGPGILVLHAWWGLTPFFKGVCDRFAAHGFVAFAPDLMKGKTAETIEEAKALTRERDVSAAAGAALAGVEALRSHPAVLDKLGAIGFSMGVEFAMVTAEAQSESFGAHVHFYGFTGMDLSAFGFPIQCHYGEVDEWEPVDLARKLTAPNVTTYVYPGVGHWFVEENKPDAYDSAAAKVAWDRTMRFFNDHLTP